MAPPARRARAEMLLGAKPKSGRAAAAERSAAVRILDVTGVVFALVV